MFKQQDLDKVKNWSSFKKIFKNQTYLEIIDEKRIIRDEKNKKIAWFLSYNKLNDADYILEFYANYKGLYKIIPIIYYFISWKHLGDNFKINFLKDKKPTINFDPKFKNVSCLGIHIFNSYLDTLYHYDKEEALYLLKYWKSLLNKSTPVFSIIPYTTHEIEWFGEEFKKLSI